MAENLDYYVNVLSGSSSGLSAIGALKSLDSSAAKATTNIQALEAKVKSAQLALRAAENGGSAKEQFKAADVLRAAQEKLTGAQRAQADSAGLLAAKRNLIKKGLDEQVAKLSQFTNAAKEAGGPLGSLVGKLEGLGKGGTVGLIVAAVAALAALAVAGVVAAVAMTKYAFASADAARSSRLFSEAALGSAKAGNELEAVVDQMGNLAPGLAVKLKDVGRSLADVQIQGRDAQRVLNTFGIVATARGEQTAGAIKGIAESSRMANRLLLGARDRFGEFASLKGTGIKAADVYAALAKSMRTSIPEAQRAIVSGLVPFKKGLEALELAAQTKLGGVVAKQMLGLSTQAEKLKENIAKLFSGVNIEKFLEGLKMVTDLFDTNTVTGYVLREAMTAIFTKVAEISAKVFPYVKAAIQGIVAGILIFATAAKQIYRAIVDTFGGGAKSIDGMGLAFKIGVGIVATFVGSILAVAAALTLLGAVALIALSPIWVPVALTALFFYAIVKAVDAVIDSIVGIGEELAEVDLGKAAENIMNTLINGLKNKIADVKSAMKDVGAAITSAFSTEMEIRSPSGVSKRLAGHVMSPFVTVPEQMTSDVQNAMTSAVVPNNADYRQSGGASQAQNGDVNIQITIDGSSNPDATARAVEERLRMFFMGEARGNALVTA